MMNPVLLIQTRADEDAAKENWQEAFLKHNIVDEFHISLNIDFESIKNEAALHYLNAAFWDTVKKQTSTKKEPEWYPEFLSYIINTEHEKPISLVEIEKHYQRKKITSDKKRTYLQADLEQLSRKGLLLYYKEDKLLNDVAWLNPAATVEDIHKTILDRGNIKTKGRISKEAFKKRKIDPKIEQLLINEKVLFFDKSSKEYIIPNYLPLTSEDDEIYDLLKFDFNKPTFVLKFEQFIPFGLINQLICHYGQNPEKKHYWRNQLIFTYEKEFKVWIQLDFSKLTISVSIKPKTAKDSKLNEVIQQLFREILFLYWDERIPNVKEEDIKKDVDQMVSTEKYDTREILDQFYKQEFKKLTKPDDLYISTDNDFFVHYNTLNNPEKTQESIVSYALPKDKNNLDRKQARTQRSYKYRNFTDNENIKKMKKIFISYSNEDVYYKRELEKFLKPFQKFQLAKSWSCEEIDQGLWDDQIQEELESSDVVIFMMSMSFAASDYILKEEVYKTFEQMAKNPEKKIVCVLVKQFPWSYFSSLKDIFNIKDEISDADKAGFVLANLPNYQFLPYYDEKNKDEAKNKRYLLPIREWEFEERAFTQIVEKLGEIV
ncbi:COR domain-containing protein [Kordia sp.]|uniref:TIR domain-containing protein n=1 Tax=Kordia sp. TaxID=1965332 RepID=UPI003D2BA1F3